jgi:hypothetical protein
MTTSGWGTGLWGTMGWGGDEDVDTPADRIDVKAVASLSSSSRAFAGTSVWDRPKRKHGKPA